jgi:hypothetical protein
LYNGRTGSKYLEYNPELELNLFFFNNETMNNEKAKESNEAKVKQKNEQKSNNEQNKQTTIIN